MVPTSLVKDLTCYMYATAPTSLAKILTHHVIVPTSLAKVLVLLFKQSQASEWGHLYMYVACHVVRL